MRKKNLAVLGLAVAISLSLIGCGGKDDNITETVPPVEAIEPTSEVVVETEVSKELGEKLIIGEAELPVMVVPGENGKAVVVDGSLEEIEDEVAKQNISIMMGEIPDETLKSSIEDLEDTEKEGKETEGKETSESLAETSESLAETIPVYLEETLSVEQMEKIEDSVREYTDKQAEEWFREVDEANRE